MSRVLQIHDNCHTEWTLEAIQCTYITASGCIPCSAIRLTTSCAPVEWQLLLQLSYLTTLMQTINFGRSEKLWNFLHLVGLKVGRYKTITLLSNKILQKIIFHTKL